ncbi:TetR/AcrR family transcriptional regulator [Nakamurella leprariae]|uniref:TetR family transcriptional regulator n=1 Tax=Nakamurella leprariae TaxID=2803911 RepID=A0A938YD48_9ACTN|nr:TetR/AcrR family transcriptional regulator [Nakamurella leprariae]MBM9465665.1 TetR family transcriptional regulator [Nakamurella leprariae]
MTTPGLRERKRQATREALRTAALRLALEHGASKVRVEDIAAAAGVSPRTYNNYFASREQAIVSAVTAGRETRVAAAVARRPPTVRLADAVTEAVVEQYTTTGQHELETLLLITTWSPLRKAFLDASAGIELPLTAAIAARLPDAGAHTARVLAASVAAAVRIAVENWLQPAGDDTSPEGFDTGGLVVPFGSLTDQLGTALAPLAPAFDAAEEQAHPEA